MADHGFDGRPAAQFAVDLGRDASLLTGDEDPELVLRRRVVAAVALVREDAAMVLPTSASISGTTIARV
jgi:hypothetical protein